MSRRGTLLRRVAVTLAVCAASLEAQHTTEVVVIGGNHAMYLTRYYTPTELRALLRKIAPDAVGVENYQDWQEAGVQFHPGLPEVAVGMSWASRAGVRVLGVKSGDNVPGWQNQARGIQRMRDSMTAVARQRTYQRSLRSIASTHARWAFEDTLESVSWIHSPAGIEGRARGRLSYPDSAQQWLRDQDDTVAAHVVALVRKHRPRRLTVIMGSDHYGPNRRLLARYPDIRVIPTEQFLPLTRAELENAWDPFDAEMVLGANLDHAVARALPVTRDHARTRKELERLIGYAPDSAPTLYFHARWHMLFERWNPAESLLARVRAGAPGSDARLPVAFQYRAPPLPTYRALATFALATLHDLRGNRTVARPLYEELLRLPQVDLQPRIDVTMSFDVRAYIDSLIKEPYAGGSAEYGRMLDARRPLFWDTAGDPIRSLAARRGPTQVPPRNDR